MSSRARQLGVLLLIGACSGGDRGKAEPEPTTAKDAASDRDANESEDAASDEPADAGAALRDATPAQTANDGGGTRDADALSLPPENAGLDYQLGGAYAPAAQVGIVSRDRNEEPAAGLYNICYVNGFQAQPDEKSFWLDQHPDLVLRDAQGAPVIDPDWDEMLLDISSADKRTRLLAIEAPWIAACARDGFAAVEVDNLDTYSRSDKRLTQDHAVAFMQLLSAEAHKHGLAIAQKNASEIAARRSELGTDFVVSEECAHYDECDVYTKAYGAHVLMIEYLRSDFDRACKQYPDYSVVLRDRQLVPKGRSGYVFEGC
jgi:hypothetical protein